MRDVVVWALLGLVAGGCGTDSHTVTITIAGDGVGWVQTSVTPVGHSADTVEGGAMTCHSSCTIDVPSGVVHLFAGTPSTFGGWSRSCDNAHLPNVGDHDCELVVTDEDVDLTVTFNRDPGELATLVPTMPASALAFDGDDLVIAGVADLQRIALDGTVRWDVSGVAASALAVSPTDGVYTLESHVIYRDRNGGTKWTSSISGSALATTPDGDVAVVTPTGVARLAASDGSVVWSADVPRAASVAVDSTGMTAVATLDGTVARFDASGTRLQPDWALQWPIQPFITFDAQDYLVVQLVDPQRPDWSAPGYCAAGGRTLERLDRTGTLMFRVEEDCIGSLPAALLPNGPDLFSFRPGVPAWNDPHIPQPGLEPSGLLLGTYGLDGVRGTWTLAKSVPPDHPLPDSVTATATACDGRGRCAIAGTYTLGNPTSALPYWPVVTSPWIEVLTVP